ncbi:hypothetical protein Fcan01_15423 [Folsomia candida]|uniref:Uncharacterized protein n=1 Tax=Folsomia candida TaxID=158441 RepID=A0A226DYG6_FOLCA|nr:hypothetical protein Fcan01_15423 [Folsomia candida]
MVIICGDTGRTQTVSAYFINMLFGHPVCLFFKLVTSTGNSFLIERNFTAFCKGARLAENTGLARLIASCQRLLQAAEYSDWITRKFQSKIEMFLGIVDTIKYLSLHEGLNYALRYLAYSGNLSKEIHGFSI